MEPTTSVPLQPMNTHVYHNVNNNVKTSTEPYKSNDFIFAMNSEIYGVDGIYVSGNGNILTTNNSAITGDNNNVYGNNNTCIGNNNNLVGKLNASNGVGNNFFDSVYTSTQYQPITPNDAMVRALSLHNAMVALSYKLRETTSTLTSTITDQVSTMNAYNNMIHTNQQLQERLDTISNNASLQSIELLHTKQNITRLQDEKNQCQTHMRQSQQLHQQSMIRQHNQRQTIDSLQQQVDFLRRIQIQPAIQIDLTKPPAFPSKEEAMHDEEVDMDADSAIICVVCMERKRKCIIQPCRHLSLCITCSATQKHDKCPVCRVPVASIERIYT